MPTELRYGIALGETRFLRRSAMRSTPSCLAASSTSCSTAKVTSGRPELRYALVGMVLVKTATERRLVAGTAYEPGMRPEPLLNGDNDTQRAPTLLILVARMAIKRCFASSANSTLVTRSRP